MVADKRHMPLLISVAILSILLLIAAVLICSKIVHHAHKHGKMQKTQNEQQRYTIAYFVWTSTISSICDVLCCFSVSFYCVFIVFEPHHNLAWFITVRALPTVFWFVAKAILIWLYNGRLYYTFGRGRYRSSRHLFLIINIWIMAAIPLHLAFGYVGAVRGTPWMVSFGFEGFRLVYLALTCYLLVMFSRKMLLLFSRYDKVITEASPTPRASVEVGSNSTQQVHKSPEADEQRRSQSTTETAEESASSFLDTATKNAVLTLFISISAGLTAFFWIIWDFVLPSNYLTLLLPMMMFSIDCVVNLCCIFLLRGTGKKFYSQLCTPVDGCCRKCLFMSGCQ